MESPREKTTQISVGTSTHRDYFQRGREAAQVAKTQNPNSTPNLVVALSDAGVHFKDFVEGVRLVTGDERLIALPSEPWLAQDAPSHETGAVVTITSRHNDFVVIPHRTNIDQLEVGTTHLASAAHRHQSDGLMVFGEDELIANNSFQRSLAADLSPDAWTIGISCDVSPNKGMACQNQFLTRGVAGIGIRSKKPWHIASVALGAFRNQPQFLEEGIKTAIRSALQRNDSAEIALVLVFLNGFQNLQPSESHRAVSQSMALMCPHTPWLGMSGSSHFAHHSDRWNPAPNETLTTVLVPA